MSSNKLSLIVNFLGIDKMSGPLKNIIGLGRDGSTSIKALSAEAKKLSGNLAEVQRELATSTGNITQLANKEQALASSLAAVNAQLARQKKLAAINSDSMAMRRTADDYKSRGQGNMGSGAVMATPFILASKAAMDFSSGMVDIQQKASLTNAETDAMASTIIRLSKLAHQMPEDMRAGIDTLSGLGLDPRDAVKMIDPIGRLGTAFKVDLADGANAAYANLNNLKVPLDQTSAALDIMAASGNAGAFEVRDMARHFPGLTAQLQALGQKGTPAVADLSAALQIARRGAGDADEAANNIKNLLGKINSPETASKFAKFGIDLPNALKKAAREGKTPLEAIAELTQKATGGDNAQMGNLFEDMQAQSALRSLILNMKDYKQMRADIQKSGGTVDKAFAQREARDASIAWKDFTGTASRLAITLGTQFLPVATSFLATANSMVGSITAFANANPRLAGTLTTVLGLLVGTRIAFGALQFAAGALLGPLGAGITLWRQYQVLGSLAAVFPNVAAGLGMMATMATRLAGILPGLLVALRAIGLFMVTTPAGLALSAILLGGAAIYANLDKIKAAFGGGAEAKPAANPQFTPMRPAAAAQGGQWHAINAAPITVNVHGAPGQAPDAIADHAIRKLEEKRGVAARSSYNAGR